MAKGRRLLPHKASLSPEWTVPTVLVNDPWTFVSLWLKRNHKSSALFYWEQALEFHKASVGLPIQSAPLLLYYSFMNVVKALLDSKSISYNPHHGVKSVVRAGGTRISIANEVAQIKNSGILPALSQYYGETETRKKHSLKELFFNLPYIHRTYCLTYPNQTEMFLSLKECGYAFDQTTRRAFLAANFSDNLPVGQAMRRLPNSFVAEPSFGPKAIRSTVSANFSNQKRPTKADLCNLRDLHHQLRDDVFYINGAETLWYLKSTPAGTRRLARRTPTITLAAMHRLSEICRYRPLELASHLAGQKNWLLTEFIQQSAAQFIDEIASEITGHQFLVPNVRPAK